MLSYLGHEPEIVANRGWDDDPDWYVVCNCGWETWNNATEEAARFAHSMHAQGSSYPSDGDSSVGVCAYGGGATPCANCGVVAPCLYDGRPEDMLFVTPSSGRSCHASGEGGNQSVGQVKARQDRPDAGRHMPLPESLRRCGPSPDYLALLRGEIEADEYVRRMKAEVDEAIKWGRHRGR